MPSNTNTTTVAPFENGAPIRPSVERLTYTAREASTALGVSTITLWRLEKRGLLLPVPGLRHKLYSLNALRRFVERGAA